LKPCAARNQLLPESEASLEETRWEDQKMKSNF
jgi:hypothetical protein